MRTGLVRGDGRPGARAQRRQRRLRRRPDAPGGRHDPLRRGLPRHRRSPATSATCAASASCRSTTRPRSSRRCRNPPCAGRTAARQRMPEGHTLRRLADDLTAAFAGRTVRVSSPQGRFAADAAVLDRSTLLGADSAGKHLFVEFDGERFVHVHLGLIGASTCTPRSRTWSPRAAPYASAWRRATGSARPTPTCAAPSCATWSPPPGATRCWASWDPTRCVPTPTPSGPGAGSRAARARSVTC